MHTIEIRRLSPADSLDELTSMLHRAFARLGRMGLNCTSFDQSVETTAQRVRLGECYVAVGDGRLIGTVTLHEPDGRSGVRWYRRPDVASLHQFAVDPSHQGTGCGKALLLVAQRWASVHGCCELALDTPAPASHLIAFYASQGFRVVEHVQLQGKSYRSAVLSKRIDAPTAKRGPRHHVPRSPHAPLFGTMVHQ